MIRPLLKEGLLAVAALGLLAPVAHATPDKVVVFVAMPGAGKSTYAKALADKLGGAPIWSSGDVIRRAVAERFGTYTIEHDKAMRSEFGAKPGSVGSLVAVEVAKANGPVGIIEGPRTVEDVDALRRALPGTKVVSIEVGTDRRHDRMLDRGRSGETSMKVLRERDESEERLGVRGAMQSADVRVRPGDGDSALGQSVDSLIHKLDLKGAR